MIIQAINKHQMERFIPDIEKIVAISLFSSGDKRLVIPCGFESIIWVQIDDIDIKMNNLVLFNEEDAKSIINFVLRTRPEKIVINCDAGISRSVGVMVALEFMFNSRNLFNKFPLHNKHIANTMLKVWGDRL